MSIWKRKKKLKTRELRKEILRLVKQYHDASDEKETFIPGETNIPPAGKVIGSSELTTMTDAVLDGWLTIGRFNDQFEKQLGNYLGVKHVLTTNSGSSANLLALTALTSPKLGKKRIQTGDEVITVAAAFPTTVNPILQNNCVPVFLDIEIPTYNISLEQLEEAYSHKTKAVMIAHTLGNPFNLQAIKDFTEKHDLWLIEDCCDALGSEYDGKKAGTFGDIGTLSFYPAHHITMGEGGAIFTSSNKLKKCIESFRDWGRDCYCPPGADNTCNKRFSWQLGELPKGYDHKYIYSHLGYNLKITDIQAACGLAQLKKIDTFVKARKFNFTYLSEKLRVLDDHIVLPKATENSDPAWFGFPITIKEKNEGQRVLLLKYLNDYKIGTRLLFAGNIIRQPYFMNRKYRIVGNLKNTEIVMNQTFWIGTFPGLTKEMLDYTANRIIRFFTQ
jgi:CDP-4-dehydro-6-deoxyglucose reductase, E1